MILSAPPSPPAAPPPVSADSARRWWAARALLLGGALVAVGLYLPWVRVHYPPIPGDPALTFFDGPGRTLFQRLREVAGAPTHFSIELLVDALIYLAAPLLVAVLGALALLRPRWLPSRRIRLTALLLALAGAVWSVLTAAIFIYFVGSLDVVRAERTLQPGAAVALLGYLCALVGSDLLPARPRSSTR